MSNKETYDSSWDHGNDALWDAKYVEWEDRDWEEWLHENLSFPIEVIRKEDMDSNPFLSSKDEPFNIGHVMKLLSIRDEDEDYGILAKVKDGQKTGYVPLSDLEVTSRNNKNFWPIREYVVWFANKT